MRITKNSLSAYTMNNSYKQYVIRMIFLRILRILDLRVSYYQRNESSIFEVRPGILLP